MTRMALFLAVVLATAIFSSVLTAAAASGNTSPSVSYVNIAGKGANYYVAVYGMNGTMLVSEYASYDTVALALPTGEYIVTVNSYPTSGYYYTGRSAYAYSVASAPFNITLDPENITLYGCSSISVTARFVNGSSVMPSYSYGYPLGDPYWYQACPESITGYNETSGVNYIEVPNVPSLVYAYYWYPVNLASGSQNITVNAGGIPVQVRVYYWPTSLTLSGRALILPPFSGRISLTLNTTSSFYSPCYGGALCPLFSAQSSLGGVSPSLAATPPVPGMQTTPPAFPGSVAPSYSVPPVLVRTVTEGPPAGYELAATLVAGALAVALIGYFVVRRANNA